jgi:hypothetical protein
MMFLLKNIGRRSAAAALLLSLVLFSGCSMNYSFTGASIPPEVKTINVKFFPNNASLVDPTLSQRLTDALREKFINETNLILVNEGGDLVLEGSITDYFTQPVSIQDNDQAALNRLTIKLDVVFTNNFDDKMSFDTQFTRFSDYSSDQNLTEVQEPLTDEINTMLVQDIFNKAVINW